MMVLFGRLVMEESGVTVTEYGRIAALIVIVTLTAVNSVSLSLNLSTTFRSPPTCERLPGHGTALGRRTCGCRGPSVEDTQSTRHPRTPCPYAADAWDHCDKRQSFSLLVR
jgi:Flp pilus assembly pilin Flp